MIADHEMSDAEYNHFSNLLYKMAGINLGRDKRALLQSRLFKRLKAVNAKDYRQYIRALKNNEKEMELFVNVLTTNKTEFFREEQHFQFIRDNLFPVWRKKPQTIFIWSAASSTGEEAYSLAMLMDAFCREVPACDYRILGTDINTTVIQTAETGIYDIDSVKGVVSAPLLSEYIIMDPANPGKCRISDGLRMKVKFRKHNLQDLGDVLNLRFDLIFLRNVLIYFDTQGVEKTVHKVTTCLKPGGYLFIGHSENLNGISHSLKQASCAVFRN